MFKQKFFLKSMCLIKKIRYYYFSEHTFFAFNLANAKHFLRKALANFIVQENLSQLPHPPLSCSWSRPRCSLACRCSRSFRGCWCTTRTGSRAGTVGLGTLQKQADVKKLQVPGFPRKSCFDNFAKNSASIWRKCKTCIICGNNGLIQLNFCRMRFTDKKTNTLSNLLALDSWDRGLSLKENLRAKRQK